MSIACRFARLSAGLTLVLGWQACSLPASDINDGRTSFVADARVLANDATGAPQLPDAAPVIYGIDAAPVIYGIDAAPATTTTPDAAPATTTTPDAAPATTATTDAAPATTTTPDAAPATTTTPDASSNSASANGADANGGARTIDAAPAAPSVDAAGAAPSPDAAVKVQAPVIVTTNADSGDGSLRDAVAIAAGAPIEFDPSLNGATILLNSTIDISGPVDIRGPGASLLTIDGGHAISIFTKDTGDFSLSGLTLANGNSDFGGAIRGLNDSGTLTIDSCVFVGNHAENYGGAIMSSDTFTLSNSTFLDNSVSYYGGALFIMNASTILNTTFDSNSSGATGSAIVAYGVSTFSFITLTNNVGRGAIQTEFNDVTLRNSLVSNNGGDNFNTDSVPTLSGGHNFIDSTDDSFTSDGTDIFSDGATFDTVGDYGGATPTVRLQANSKALDVVPVEACTDGAGKPLTTDQRGEARPVGKGCDVGAFERQVSDVTPTISAIADQTLAAGAEISIGFNVGDETYGSDALKIESSDGKPGVLAEEKLDGKSDKRSITLVAGASSGSTTVTITVTNRDGAQASTTFNVTIKAPVAAVIVTNTADSGAGSLRDAVANAAGAPIQFDRSLNGSTISLQSPINVSVAGGVTIQGPGASQLTIDGGNAVGLFVKDSGDFAISGVTLANGNNDFGGAIRGLNDSGTLTIDACLFLDNHADQYGGAIMSSDALTITNSAFVGNSINWFGGALMSQGNTATILNTTFDSNSAGAGGSALVVYGTATLSFVTITNNVGASAFWTEFQTVTLRNSLVAQNGGGNFHTDSIQAVSGGYNLIDNNNGPFTSDRTDNIGGTIASDAIGDNGGETLTVALEPESAAIDAVPVEACTDAGGTPLTVDQRGFARPAGVACDAGAFERQLK